MTELATRRNEIESELSRLRQQRAAATLAGKKYDGSKISALTDELDALAEAEGERARRNRARAEIEHQKNQATLRKELAAAEDERLRSIQDANAHARGLAESLEKAMDASRRISQLLPAVSKVKVAAVLTPNEVASRLSGRLSAVMQSIRDHPVRFGGIEWRGASRFMHADDWREKERALAEPHLKPLLQKDKRNAKDSS